ncbi:Lrp/AsnC family transcriptional regulator [Reichenbachiella versicolor]|uniref:Lrp/AsnC family transcriptional regulator n=1 Tax=Reichenbachiella versicolor TaxID=1821036 RepID=UPI000D6DE24D|nr:Lrp/AsnC family transcriptional regulator [Reichenbachiella versicolor]
MKKELDQIDKNILNKLSEDARMPYSGLANDLKVSNTLVHQRVNNLIEHGVLEKFSPVINERKLGYEWSAFTGLTLKEDSSSESIVEELRKIPNVTECYYISGQYTLFVRIVARSNEEMRSILYDQIDHIKGISKTESIIDFGCAFRRNIPL